MPNIRCGFLIIILVGLLWLPLSSTLIHDVTKKGELQKLKQILKKTPGLINTQDKNMNTPLHYAASAGHKEIAEFLIASGANIQARNNYGWTPLHSSSYYGQEEIGRLLINKGIDINAPDIFRWTPLFRAIQGNRKNMVKFLVKHGADINFIDKNGRTPLFLAVLRGKKEIVEYLLEKGAIRSLNKADGTLLHVAAGSGFVDIVKLFIKKEKKIDIKKIFDLTPLHLAAAFGNKGVVQFLCENGSDINAVSKEAGTPLSLAIASKHQEVADLLVAKGAKKGIWQFTELKGKYLGQKKPGLTPRPFAKGILSNLFRPHSSLSMSPEGTEIYWSASGSFGRQQRIWFTRQENGVWTAPCVADFSTGYTFGSPFISPDGKKLFFHSNRPLKPGRKPENNENIWVMNRIGSRWSEPENPGSVLNSKHAEVCPSISKKGNIFFQGYYPEKGFGASDLYMSKFDNGKYLRPVNLGSTINTSYSECVPQISPDETYLIFQSQRPGRYTNVNDLYISFRRKDGKWTKAKNMGKSINSNMYGLPYVSPDGKYLFFVRRKNGIFEHWWVSTKIIEDLKPKELK